MISLDDIFRLLKNDSRPASNNGGSSGVNVPPLSPDGRAAAQQAARDILAPKQSDQSYLSIHQMGPDGVVLQQGEEWIHGTDGLKALRNEVRVATCTGQLVEPKALSVVCRICGGYDSVVNHCRCGVAVCRRCLRHDPTDESPLCVNCHAQALQFFNTWAAHDRQVSKGGSS